MCPRPPNVVVPKTGRTRPSGVLRSPPLFPVRVPSRCAGPGAHKRRAHPARGRPSGKAGGDEPSRARRQPRASLMPPTLPAGRGNLYQVTNFGGGQRFSELNHLLAPDRSLRPSKLRVRRERERGDPSRRGQLGGTSGTLSCVSSQGQGSRKTPLPGSPRGSRTLSMTPGPGSREWGRAWSLRPTGWGDPPVGPPAGPTASRPHWTGPPRSRVWAPHHRGQRAIRKAAAAPGQFSLSRGSGGLGRGSPSAGLSQPPQALLTALEGPRGAVVARTAVASAASAALSPPAPARPEMRPGG